MTGLLPGSERLANPITDPLALAELFQAKPKGSIGYVCMIWPVNFTTVETLAAELNGTVPMCG
jgi:hypothetical protein